MAIQPMDALTSFQHVADNVDSWRTSISELAVYVAKQHDMYVAEYSRLLDQATTKKRKSESVVSIRSDDEAVTPLNNVAVLKSPNPSELVNISPFEAGNRFIYAQAHRKRKPGTSMRSNASETTRYRSKQMVVVYYDSHTQVELDRIVKSLGTARNNLRKGKNAYTAAKGFSLPTLNRRIDIVATPSSKPTLASPKLSNGSSPRSSPEPMSVDAAFPSTDKELEATQALCETAAHQILRDGDCRIELNTALKKMDNIFNYADAALGLLKAENSEGQSLSPSVETHSASGKSSSTSTLCDKSPPVVDNTYQKVYSPNIESLTPRKASFAAVPYSPPTVLVADAIEVDDDDDSNDSSVEIDLDITNFRAAGRSRLVT